MITVSPLSGLNPYILVALNRLLKQLKRSRITNALATEDIIKCWENGHCTIFVAKDSEMRGSQKYIGMSTVFFQRVPTHWLGEIHDVVVDTQYRNGGVGTLLMEEMIKTARVLSHKHARGVRLSLTSAPSRNTHSFYTHLGFELIAKANGNKGSNLYQMVVIPVEQKP